MSIQLSELLSKQARTLHTTRRSYFEKRIIELKQEKYVLYRFPKAATANKFADIIEEAHQAGASLQKIVARPSKCFRHCRWLALSFEVGEQIHGKNEAPTIFASLGKTLAILHRQTSSTPGPLVHNLPALDEKLDPSLCTDAISEWLEASHQRLCSLKDYRLNHGDLSTKNIIASPENGSVLIDYELFSYDLAGIELGMLLLRHCCRQEHKRKVLLENYLAHCDTKTKELWEEHWQDFLVAAALRIAAQRDRRRRVQQRLKNWLEKLLRLPLPSRLRTRIETSQKEREVIIESAHRGAQSYQWISSRLIHLIISERLPDASTLLSACFRQQTGRTKRKIQLQGSPSTFVQTQNEP